jgi:predicted lactoylglutathione lyase
MSGANVKQAVPFFWVMDLEKSLHYYVNGLGFSKKKEWVVEGKMQWCWLDHGDASIMLQEFWKDAPQRKTSANKLGEGVSIAFVCEDALSLYREFLSKGIVVDEPFVGNGMWVVSVSDPDGYKLFFESVTDVPEETLYSQWKKE